jgi:uncharacterized lipoprotein YehR (DUF1307 family)
MKLKHRLKTVGLLTLFSISSLVIVSCDDDNRSAESEEIEERGLKIGDKLVYSEDAAFEIISENTILYNDSSLDPSDFEVFFNRLYNYTQELQGNDIILIITPTYLTGQSAVDIPCA